MIMADHSGPVVEVDLEDCMVHTKDPTRGQVFYVANSADYWFATNSYCKSGNLYLGVSA